MTTINQQPILQPTQQLGRLLPVLSDLVDRIDPEQLEASTPCEDFTVADILDHMITLGGAFSYLFRGEEPPTAEGPVCSGGVPKVTFRRVMADLLAAVESPGALERRITAPIGEMDGETFARLVAFDGLIHGWDLARATGQPYNPDPGVVAAVDGFARQALTPDMRGEAFAEPTSVVGSVSPLDALVAFSGRTV